jgi:hypothetical protein
LKKLDAVAGMSAAAMEPALSVRASSAFIRCADSLLGSQAACSGAAQENVRTVNCLILM